MKPTRIGTMTIMFFLLLTSGCANDVKDIERLNYATAMGVDYKEGKYYGYIQFIDMMSEAKLAEGQKEPTKIWIGEGEGDTFEETFFNLYRTAQERIYWGHMTAIVISESAMKQGIGSIVDSFTRYYEFRLTPWIYGTKDSVRDILNLGGFYGQSPLKTILHEPEETYTQTSNIKSIRLHRLIRDLNEPGYTSCIPTLAVNKKQWLEKGKQKPLLNIDGAIFYTSGKFRSYIPLRQLSGLRWIQEGVRAGIPVPNPKQSVLQMVIDNPKTKIKVVQDRKSVV